jgi:tetratricopeptide (TPR) repeat protein
VSLALAGRGTEALTTAERAISYDSTLMITRFMQGATQIYLRQPARAIQPLEAAVQIDPDSRLALGVLGYAYGAAGDVAAARRIRARIEAMPDAPGGDIAIARISLALGDTSDALQRLERAARARDPFFATEPTVTPMFEAIRHNPRYLTLLRSVGLTVPAAIAAAETELLRGSSD